MAKISLEFDLILGVDKVELADEICDGTIAEELEHRMIQPDHHDLRSESDHASQNGTTECACYFVMTSIADRNVGGDWVKRKTA